MMELFPPEDALSIENLFCHLRMTFNSGLSSSDKVLKRIGILSDYTTYTEQNQANYFRYLDVNIAAVGNIIDTKIDLSSLLNSENIGDIGSAGVFTDGSATIVYLETANSSDSTNDTDAGTINVWKLDGTYTTQKIR
jgi:hypothetical protein